MKSFKAGKTMELNKRLNSMGYLRSICEISTEEVGQVTEILN
jgi:hypothetical protein